MCTKAEVKEVLLDVLDDVDEEGVSIIGHHMDRKAKEIVGTLTMRFGVALIGMVLTAAGTWYATVHRIDLLEEVTVRNAAEIEKGGRYTKEDAATRDEEVQRQILELKEADAQLRADQIEATNAVRSDIRELRGLILAQ